MQFTNLPLNIISAWANGAPHSSKQESCTEFSKLGLNGIDCFNQRPYICVFDSPLTGRFDLI